MARTTLMRTLQRIAADCREADRRGVPVEFLDELRADESSRLTRRDLIAPVPPGAAATFGPAAFAGAARAEQQLRPDAEAEDRRSSAAGSPG